MTSEPRPQWRRPGMSEREVREWLAAERAVADAPEIKPGDNVWLDLKPLVAGFVQAHPDQQVQDPAA